MNVRCLKLTLRTTAAGFAVLSTAASGFAGILCPEQPSRPHVSAAAAPNWGFNQTCWQRFPPVLPCDSSHGGAADIYGTLNGYSQLGMPYASESVLQAPVQAMTSQPVSVMPHSGGMRYSAGSPTSESPSGAAFRIPPTSAGAPGTLVPQAALPPMPSGYGVEPIAPVLSQPALMPADAPSQGIRTFQAVPLPQQQLSSPQFLPTPVPPQSNLMPNQLTFGADGRIAVVSVNQDNATARQPATFSRYGRRMDAMPPVDFQTPAESRAPASESLMQFANTPSVLSESSQHGSARYGHRTATMTSPAPSVQTRSSENSVRGVSQSRAMGSDFIGSRYAKPAQGR